MDEDKIDTVLNSQLIIEDYKIYGLVSKGTDSSHILYSKDKICDNWIKIPVVIINEIRPIGTERCSDGHYHHFVEVELKSPVDGFEGVYAELIM